MKVYLLTEEQAAQLAALNTQAATSVICDHGHGICVGENDYDHPAFASHKAKLDSFGLTITEIPDPEFPF